MTWEKIALHRSMHELVKPDSLNMNTLEIWLLLGWNKDNQQWQMIPPTKTMQDPKKNLLKSVKGKDEARGWGPFSLCVMCLTSHNCDIIWLCVKVLFWRRSRGSVNDQENMPQKSNSDYTQNINCSPHSQPHLPNSKGNHISDTTSALLHHEYWSESSTLHNKLHIRAIKPRIMRNSCTAKSICSIYTHTYIYQHQNSTKSANMWRQKTLHQRKNIHTWFQLHTITS